MKTKWLGLLAAGFLVGCQNPNVAENEPEQKVENTSSQWRGVISLNDSIDMPFLFDLMEEKGAMDLTIKNGEETIQATEISEIKDSLKIQFPVFSNYLMVKKSGDEMSGFYINPDAKNYRLPFRAEAGVSKRFEASEKNCCEINKKWAVQFGPNSEKPSPAIAHFVQEGSHVTGTFMTETGDYRFLEGALNGEKLQLSTFDGAHLFYFEGTIENGQKMTGLFYSGRSFMKPWMAYRDDDFQLRNPDSLTYLNEGFETVDFSFPNADGQTISLSDERFQNKAVIVQILGSWCPNCMDETRYLADIYDEYHDDGLEIVGLTFEHLEDSEKAWERVNKMKKDLEIPYPILLAGTTEKGESAKALPMLNRLMSYPTSIYLWPDHSVKTIHTGFSGPGTPVYGNFLAKNKQNIEQLLSGKPRS